MLPAPQVQKIVQLGREKATEAARIKLQTCSEDFKIFGEKEWKKQCSKTLLHKILDQHFTVKSSHKSDVKSSDKTIAVDSNSIMQTVMDNLSHYGNPTGCTTWLSTRVERMSIRISEQPAPLVTNNSTRLILTRPPLAAALKQFNKCRRK